MKCEEFEATGLGIERDSTGSAAEQAVAREHASTCSRCAALQESWQDARLGLQALRAATQQAETSGRVEMRLRQEFRTKNSTLKIRRRAVFAAWTLAAAALLLGFVTWWNWRLTQQRITARHLSGPVTTSPDAANSAAARLSKDSVDESALLANNEGDFTLLPGSLPQETQDAAIFRVRLQRRALADMGLPVNEERATDWIQVDLLVGEDGQPRAVRVPSELSN